MKSLRILILALATVFSLHLQAGQGADGGVFVQIQPPSEEHPLGVWVTFDEAVHFFNKTHLGLNDYINSDCNPNCRDGEKTNYASTLIPWLELFEEINVGGYKELLRKGELLDIMVTDVKIKEGSPPESEADLRKLKRVTVFRPEEGHHGTLYISAPVIEIAGQAGPDRLNARENQGLVIFEELVESFLNYLPENQQNHYVEALLKAHYSRQDESRTPWSPVDFNVRLSRLGIPAASDPFTTAKDKRDLIAELDEVGIKKSVPPFKNLSGKIEMVEASDMEILTEIEEDSFDPLRDLTSREDVTQFYESAYFGAQVGEDIPEELKTEEIFQTLMDRNLISIESIRKRFDLKYVELNSVGSSLKDLIWPNVLGSGCDGDGRLQQGAFNGSQVLCSAYDMIERIGKAVTQKCYQEITKFEGKNLGCANRAILEVLLNQPIEIQRNYTGVAMFYNLQNVLNFLTTDESIFGSGKLVTIKFSDDRTKIKSATVNGRKIDPSSVIERLSDNERVNVKAGFIPLYVR